MTSTMLDRVKRAMMPMGPSASVTVGSTHCMAPPQPPVGKIGSTKENKTIRKHREHKVRHADAQRRDGDRDVVPRAISGRRPPALERYAPRHRQHERHAAEEQRHREGVDQDLAHRARLVHEGLAEVTLEALPTKMLKLFPERLVQTVGGGEVLLRLGRERVGALGHRVGAGSPAWRASRET